MIYSTWIVRPRPHRREEGRSKRTHNSNKHHLGSLFLSTRQPPALSIRNPFLIDKERKKQSNKRNGKPTDPPPRHFPYPPPADLIRPFRPCRPPLPPPPLPFCLSHGCWIDCASIHVQEFRFKVLGQVDGNEDRVAAE